MLKKGYLLRHYSQSLLYLRIKHLLFLMKFSHPRLFHNLPLFDRDNISPPMFFLSILKARLMSANKINNNIKKGIFFINLSFF